MFSDIEIRGRPMTLVDDNTGIEFFGLYDDDDRPHLIEDGDDLTVEKDGNVVYTGVVIFTSGTGHSWSPDGIALSVWREYFQPESDCVITIYR